MVPTTTCCTRWSVASSLVFYAAEPDYKKWLPSADKSVAAGMSTAYIAPAPHIVLPTTCCTRWPVASCLIFVLQGTHTLTSSMRGRTSTHQQTCRLKLQVRSEPCCCRNITAMVLGLACCCFRVLEVSNTVLVATDVLHGRQQPMREFVPNNRNTPAAATPPSGGGLSMSEDALYPCNHPTRHCHYTSMWQGPYCTTIIGPPDALNSGCLMATQAATRKGLPAAMCTAHQMAWSVIRAA